MKDKIETVFTNKKKNFPLFKMKGPPTSPAIFVKTVEIYLILIYFVVEDDTTVDGMTHPKS